MVRGLFKLTLLEIKIFVREPLGFVGTVLIPVAMFLLLGRTFSSNGDHSTQGAQLLTQRLPIFATVFIAISAALSLVSVISIYREGGILKRLRATPLRPAVILGAHVLVKLLFTGLSLGLMALMGRRFLPAGFEPHLMGFSLAVALSTLAILSMGFVIASIVPTARFAQPIGSAILYPMLALSGMFVSLEAFPKGWAMLGNLLPVTHAVSLIQGAWVGAPWLELLPHAGVLVLTIAVCLVLTNRVFRWE